MIVCVCTRISDRDVRDAAAAGVVSTDEVFRRRETAPCCGACLSTIDTLLSAADRPTRAA